MTTDVSLPQNDAPERIGVTPPSPAAIAALRVYTAGYQGHDPLTLLVVAARLNAAIVDVRFRPFSHNPVWRLHALEGVYFSRYLHLKAWGNPHYRDNRPIEIQDFDGGLEGLHEWLAGLPYSSVILLCQCRDAAWCHRTMLAERLRGLGGTVTELEWPQKSVLAATDGRPE